MERQTKETKTKNSDFIRVYFDDFIGTYFDIILLNVV